MPRCTLQLWTLKLLSRTLLLLGLIRERESLQQ
ncbi:hypothetical protein Goari_014053 [Gossypium aridum]|uniref:Uncharacterized protein n=1 Tax=Gossypium aridum TaxID=34290 RepID=A0A7J8XGM9_GOSAI|nr:hypothetical protein [Gossypium aridum]